MKNIAEDIKFNDDKDSEASIVKGSSLLKFLNKQTGVQSICDLAQINEISFDHSFGRNGKFVLYVGQKPRGGLYDKKDLEKLFEALGD
jgi:hypothetical protein